nr:MAG TPA: hypothetical protein [Caudoviricetes sp.]
MSDNFLEPIVNSLLDVGTIALKVSYKAYDKWGNYE